MLPSAASRAIWATRQSFKLYVILHLDWSLQCNAGTMRQVDLVTCTQFGLSEGRLKWFTISWRDRPTFCHDL